MAKASGESSAGEAYPQIFIDPETKAPINIFIHPSIRPSGSRAKLKSDIENHGGKVTEQLEEAETVIIDAQKNKTVIQTAYHGDANLALHKIWVEYASWVRECIRAKKFSHEWTRKAMKGVPARRARNEFTEEEDRHLQEYIARTIPEEEAGGRLAISFYEALVKCGEELPSYAWVRNHTAESWRQRYKRHREEMDIEIHRIALANPPIVKQMWHEDRRLTHKALSKAEAEEFRRLNAQEEEEAEGDEEEYRPRPNSTPKRQRASAGAPRPRPATSKRAATRQTISGSAPTPKRQRVELEATQATVVNPTQVLSAKALGKQRAEESDEESLFGDRDIDWESSNLVDDFQSQWDFPNLTVDEEPGPSTREARYSAGGTAAVPSERVQVASAPGPSQITQKTLVGTDPSTRPSDKNIVAFAQSPVSSPERGRTAKSVAARKVSSSTRPEPSDDETGGNPDLPSPPTKPTASSPTALFIPSPGPSPSAPYRNTRSRSRSVEPLRQVQPSTIKMRKKTQPPPTIAEEPLSRASTKGGKETLEEEQDVANLLMEPISGASSRAAPPRAPSLESDDAQTKAKLTAKPRLTGRFSGRMKASELLKRHLEGDSSAASRQSTPALFNFPTSSPIVDFAAKTFHRPSGFGTTPRPSLPRTPVRKGDDGSESEADRFPLPSTRASMVKKELEEGEKKTPYRPPRGTRAARYSAIS